MPSSWVIMGFYGILWDDSRVGAKWQGQGAGSIYHFSFDIFHLPSCAGAGRRVQAKSWDPFSIFIFCRFPAKAFSASRGWYEPFYSVSTGDWRTKPSGCFGTHKARFRSWPSISHDLFKGNRKFRERARRTQVRRTCLQRPSPSPSVGSRRKEGSQTWNVWNITVSREG
jgi:hypothetical protein